MSSMIQSRVPITQPQSTQLTVAEFINLYADEPVELIDGKLAESPMPSLLHGYLMLVFGHWIREYLLRHTTGLIVAGDVKIRFAADTILGPDLAYFEQSRLTPEAMTEFPVTIIPNMAVEIRSPSNTWNELLTKVEIYLDAGVQVVVIIDPTTRSIQVFRVDRSQHEFNEAVDFVLPDLFPGFSKPVRDLFPA